MERSELENIVQVLRHSTILVKVMPFLFAFFYILDISSYMWLPDDMITCFDLCVYISPIVILYDLILSKIFKLCKWHRLECILPLFGLTPVLIDKFIIEIGAYGQLANWIILLSAFILSLINAYFVFIKN